MKISKVNVKLFVTSGKLIHDFVMNYEENIIFIKNRSKTRATFLYNWKYGPLRIKHPVSYRKDFEVRACNDLGYTDAAFAHEGDPINLFPLGLKTFGSILPDHLQSTIPMNTFERSATYYKKICASKRRITVCIIKVDLLRAGFKTWFPHGRRGLTMFSISHKTYATFLGS